MSDTLEGSVERITYYSEETGYCVLKLSPHQPQLGQKEIAVVGTMPEIQPGESLKIIGEWTTHPQFGRQFKAEQVIQQRPATAEGIRKYLSSNLIKGVGPVTAKRIVDFFGGETLDVLDKDPERVREVPGVGKYRAEMIAKAWVAQRAIKEVMLFLQSYGLNTSIAFRIYQTYGDEALTMVQVDPYRLVKDIWGVGFLTADRLAQELGIPPTSITRLKAGIAYVLNEASNDGHLYLPRQVMIAKTTEMLGVEEHYIDQALGKVEDADEIILTDIDHPETGEPYSVIYYAPFFYAERNAVRYIHGIIDNPASRLEDVRSMPRQDLVALMNRVTKSDGVNLAAQQEQAVMTALREKLTVLTGGPGTGKTTTLRTVISILQATGHSFKLASPTGRAAKRLSEATGEPAQTIHRLLSYSPREGYGANEENPLNTDMVVIDEASMIDQLLFYALIRAVQPQTHVLMVGDVDQLPSVGAGDVLRDLIASRICSVIQLQTIFRQSGDSMIIENAHLINEGEMPDTRNQSSDFFFFAEDDAEQAAHLLVDVVQNRIPEKFGYDPVDDIQVLAPMYRGRVGVNDLNELLQDNLNPSMEGRKAQKRISGTLFRVGDKVLQLRNNYDKEVFNGDIGRVHSFNFEDQSMVVDMEGRLVPYEWGECDELTHAYAISVHKSQGSEYPVVVMPVHTQHYMMLQRNLLYTGVTRAKRMVVLVGTRKALSIMVRNNSVSERFTAFDWRLRY